MITSYCSLYGPSDIFIVDTIEEIYNFIIDYVIYPSTIFKNISFKNEDILTIENIKNNQNKKNIQIICKRNINLYWLDTYYVTVKILEDIPRLKLNNNLLKMIRDYKK